jgi:hypothetical protein
VKPNKASRVEHTLSPSRCRHPYGACYLSTQPPLAADKDAVTGNHDPGKDIRQPNRDKTRVSCAAGRVSAVFSPPLDLGLPGGLTFFMDLEAKYVTGILRGLQSKSAPKV